MEWTELTAVLLAKGLLASGPAPTLRRADLLAELTEVTRQECSGHDDLVRRYDAALDTDTGPPNELARARLRIGRLRAEILRAVQVGDSLPDDVAADALREQAAVSGFHDATADAEVDALAAELTEAIEGPGEPCAPRPRPSLTELEQSTEDEPAEPMEDVPLRRTEEQDSPPSEVLPTRQQLAPTTPTWTAGERWLVATGTATAAAGVGAMLTGAIGPILAQRSERIGPDGPTPAQQRFLIETVPRRSAIALGIGGLLLAAGVGTLTGTLAHRRVRRKRR